MKKILVFLIKIYQITFRSFVGQNCRFFPTCSDYAIEAIQKHGSFKGTILTIKRLLKCHPFHKGGDDPVP